MPLPRPSAFSRLALAALAPLALTAPAGATDFTDNVSVQSALLCVGSACGTSARASSAVTRERRSSRPAATRSKIGANRDAD